jgi:hypothetical protein
VEGGLNLVGLVGKLVGMGVDQVGWYVWHGMPVRAGIGRQVQRCLRRFRRNRSSGPTQVCLGVLDRVCDHSDLEGRADSG